MSLAPKSYHDYLEARFDIENIKSQIDAGIVLRKLISTLVEEILAKELVDELIRETRDKVLKI